MRCSKMRQSTIYFGEVFLSMRYTFLKITDLSIKTASFVSLDTDNVPESFSDHSLHAETKEATVLFSLLVTDVFSNLSERDWQ